MAGVERRRVLASGALGVTTFALPPASAAATSVDEAEVSAPSSPVTGADVFGQTAGGDLTIQLAVTAGVQTHAYWLWTNTASRPADPIGDPTGYADEGDDFISLIELDLTQSHVVEVKHTNSAGSAVSTLTLSPQSTTSAAASATTIAYAESGYGPSAVTFTLTGGSGGGGGADNSEPGGKGGGGDVIEGSLVVADGDSIRVHLGGGGVGGTGSATSTGGGSAGSSTLTGYDGGDGGDAGSFGSSGGGGGGGAATVLRRTRGGVTLDVVAAGGGGGGAGWANYAESAGVPIDGRSHASYDPPQTSGQQGTDVTTDNSGGKQDGGGGGGGGGGVAGGAGGGLTDVNVDGGTYEWFGQGGRAGKSTASDDAADVTVSSATSSAETVAGANGADGSGTVRWHSVTVSHTP